MAQKGDRRRGKPLNPDLGYAGDPVHHATSNLPSQRIGIRELRQHASVYVDLVERGYTVDITNRGRLVAQMIPVRDPESPLERWIAKGVIERAEDDGSVLEIDPYPGAAGGAAASASEALGAAARHRGRGPAVIYLDSSALVKLALAEPETAALTDYLASRSEPGARLELPAPRGGAPRHLAGRAGALPRAQRIIRRVSLVSLTHDLLDNAATLPPGRAAHHRGDPPGLGAGDQAGPDRLRLLRQAAIDAAEAAGLPVAAPA